ncbi:hypothetical protein HPB52_009911 [Rhipicephalus sanguineus]|uniref:Uncharacterized protein n=1 Tax=Rhipicephalus sanguineus TaxID=34632 RepID=A0A9D4Q080_RHISA|nr:hypothetical protein HPB52_009911 [Rhipicephalus sanguineus]
MSGVIERGPKLSLSDCYKLAGTRAPRHCTQCTLNGSQGRTAPYVVVDFEHVLWVCASAGHSFTQKETKKLIKAQDQTSHILAVQRAHARAVRFHLMVPE